MPLTKVKLKVKPEDLLPPKAAAPFETPERAALIVQEKPQSFATPRNVPVEAQPEAPPTAAPPAEEREVEELRKLIEGVKAPVEQPTVEQAPAAPLVPRIEFEKAPEVPSATTAKPVAAPEQPISSLTELQGAPAPSIEPGAPVSVQPRVLKVKKMWRVPRFKLRDSSRLEGAELPLPPIAGGKPVRTPSGYLVIGDGVVRVYAEKEGPWGPLQPLVEHDGTQEIFVRELDGEVHITAGIEGKRYIVELPRELLVERLVQRIAIEAGIPLSERNPQDSGEFRGWRVNLALPQLAGGWQLSAARVIRVEPFKAEPLLLARLVALAASPNSITFVGPPGSGKTTSLIGVLNAVLAFWPKLRVSIVEEEPEVATQVRGPNVVSYFSFADRNVTANIRATRRYDRPDILVVGELRGEEVPSWFEAAGSGIPVLTTAHSRELGDALKRLDALIQAVGLQASVIDAVRVWVSCGKVVSSEGGIQRGVQAVYVVDARGFIPVYKGGKYLPEDDFLKLLPPELQLSLEGVSEAEKVYSVIKQRLNAEVEGARFEKMEPLLPEEVS